MNKHILAASAILAGLMLTGCGDDTITPSIPGNIQPILAPPTAVNDAYNDTGNAQLTVAAPGVLANDTPNGATISANTQPAHGTVTLNANGSFTYTPTTGFQGSDSFTYTLTNSGGSSMATVSITVSGIAFFVNNQAAAGGNGSQAAPFQTLAQATAAATGVNGAQIIVARGSGVVYTDPVTLGTNQQLLGQDSANQPTLTGPVTLTSGNRVQDVRIVGTTGTAVNAAGASNGVLQDVTIANATGRAVSLDNATGTFAVTNCTVANIGPSFGVAANCTTGSLIWAVTGSSFTNVTASVAGQILATASQNVTVTGNTFTGGTLGQIALSGNSTATAFNLTITNNTVQGNGTALRGIDILNQGSTTMAGRILSNSITGCTAQGVLIATTANAITKIRYNDNRTTGNQPNLGFEVDAGTGSNVSLAMQRNTSDVFGFSQAGTGVLRVEDFAGFNSTEQNVGTVQTFGTITDVPSGSGGIP